MCPPCRTCVYDQAVGELRVAQHGPSQQDVVVVQHVVLSAPPQVPSEGVEPGVGLLAPHHACTAERRAGEVVRVNTPSSMTGALVTRQRTKRCDQCPFGFTINSLSSSKCGLNAIHVMMVKTNHW